MIAYKELSGTMFTENITFKMKASKSRYSRNYESTGVYTAETVFTKKHTCVLSVCLYLPTEKENEWTLGERHFLTENGEMASEAYLGDGAFKRGEFKIGNGNVSTRWGYDWYCSFSWTLRSGFADAYAFPYGDADKTIGDFLKRFDAFAGYDVHNSDFNPKSMLSWLADYQVDFFNDKIKKATQRRNARVRDLMYPYSDTPEDMKKWIFTERLKLAPWFYSYSHKHTQKGKCSVCKNESQLDGVRDYAKRICPVCGAEIQCINIRAKRYTAYCASKIDWANSCDTVYHQILSDGKFLSRYFFSITRYEYDIDTGEINRKDELTEYSRDFWEIVREQQIAALDSVYEKRAEWEKVSRRSIRYVKLGACWPGNLDELVHATGIPTIQNMDIAPLCAKWGRHIIELLNGLKTAPVVENLGKEGLHSLAESIIYGYGAADGLGVCSSNKPYKFLGVSKTILPFFAEIDVSVFQVKVWRELGLTEKDIKAFCKLCNECAEHLSEVSKIMLKYRLPIVRLSNYLEKQRTKMQRKSGVGIFFIDYVVSAEKLGFDLTGNRELFFPQDIKKEHDRCNDLVFIKESTVQNEHLQRRTKLLERLSYKDKKFIIRPLRSMEDFINESNKLDHCVKTYTKRCVEGTANIFGLRKIDEPDEPYFTVNISSDGRLIENHGLHNVLPTSEVKAFVDKWLKVVTKRLEKEPIDASEKEETTQNIRIGA